MALVLVGCEFSGVVRGAFRERGHEAFSCDILPSLDNSPYHIQDDIFNVINMRKWELGIFHPPCTYLTVAGNRWYYDKPELIQEGLEFVLRLAEAPIEKIAIENPVGRLSTLWRKPDQYVHPWMFGHLETKKTGLWLKNLPLLIETNNVYDEMMTLPIKKRNRIHYMSPSKDRGYLRSITFQGLAEAMANQWSK